MNPAQRQMAEGILFTDAYQLSMAPLYFRAGPHEKLARFDHFFARIPVMTDMKVVFASPYPAAAATPGRSGALAQRR